MAPTVCKRCWLRNNLQWALLLAALVIIFEPSVVESDRLFRAALVFILIVGAPWFVLKQLHPRHGS
jgi:hypothetical protein